MSIFNKISRKELEDINRALEKKIKELEKEKDQLRGELSTLTDIYKRAVELPNSEPEGCKRGPWCKACEFVKTYTYHQYGSIFSSEIVEYQCGKGESCKHFVQKEIKE